MSAPLAAPRRASVRNESNPAQWSGGRLATVNVRSPEKWLTQVGVRGHGQESAEPVEHRALLEERLMMGLRLHEGVALETVEEIIDTHAIAALQQAGLLENDSERLRTTPQGRLVLNRLIERLAV